MPGEDSDILRLPSRISFSPKPLENEVIDMNFVKHPEFYFSDGSLAIRIAGTIFKVHASVLGRHSEVFRDMTELPQPPGDQCETVDGVPVVDLQDDAQEFEDTLHAIYDPFHFDCLDDKSKLSEILSFVSGPLRITTKYAMTKLRAKCIALLEAKFPSTLDGCIALLKSQFQYTPADIVRLIALANRSHANVPSVLPWAYYLCTHMPIDDIIKDEVLTWENKALVLAGKEKLWRALKKHSHKMLFQFIPSPSCTSDCVRKVPPQHPPIVPVPPFSYSNPPVHNPLSQLPGFSVCKFWMSLDEAEDLRKAPHPLEEYDSDRWKSSNVCGKCFANLGVVHREGRMKVWKDLPTYFELGTWESIQKAQAA